MQRATICFWLTAMASGGVALAGDATRRPNVVIVYTDDQGWTDLGIHGVDPDVRTPHLDQLAREGALFLAGYSTAPQCVPARAGLMAGRHQNAFGVDDNLKGPLPHDEYTLAERLRDAGYVTGMVGKWHLDLVRSPDGQGQRSSIAYLPHTHGFEEYFCGSMQSYQASHDLAGRPLADPPQVITDNRYRVDVQTEAALGFLRRRADDPRPFLLYLAYFAPHSPLEDPPHYMERMAHVEEYARRMGLASILAMDDGMGRIREQLATMGAAANTLIFFTSDNGAPLREGAYVGSHNTPLVGEKGMETDGGQRVPFLAAWPGTIPGGQVFEQPVWSLDITATAVAVANAPLDDRIEGVNLMPWLIGERNGPVHDSLVWRWRSQAAILRGDWKFIRVGDQLRYLFEMSDIGKQTAADNKIEEFPAIAAKWEQALQDKADTWAIPGLPDEPVEADLSFFYQHVEQTLPPLPYGEGRLGRYIPWRREPADTTPLFPPASVDDLQGWVVRQGTLAKLPGGELRVTTDTGQTGFLARLGLELQPPITLEVEARAAQPITLTPTWRIRGSARDFRSDPTTQLRFPAGNVWTTETVRLPEEMPVVHVRLVFSDKGPQTLDLRHITLRDAREGVRTFRFGP